MKIGLKLMKLMFSVQSVQSVQRDVECKREED